MNKICSILIIYFLFILAGLNAQVGIGTTTPHSSAQLEMKSTDKGVLLPRMTAAQRAAIASPVIGLIIFQTDGTKGIYYFDGSLWRNLATGFIPNANGLSVYLNVIVSTFAGSSIGFADGNGTAAQFYSPTSVAVDRNGNIYVADLYNYKIRKIDSFGNVSTFAGSSYGFADGSGTAAKFANPYGVAIDNSNNVYVADEANHKIRKIDPSGNVTTFAGSIQGFFNGSGLVARFSSPRSVAVDGSGNVYVGDYLNHKIRKIDPSGNVTTFAGSTAGFADGSGTAAQFNYPTGVAVDGSGNVYVADASNHKIRKIDPSGNVTTFAGSTQGFANGSGTTAQFTYPSGVAVDGSGNVYVADASNHKIRKIDPSGNVTTLAGSTSGFADGSGTAAQFSSPIGVAVDGSGNVYVADYGNHKIRKVLF